MRVFIAGATGVLGRRLVAECSERGHEVIGLTRDESGDELVRGRGGDPRRGDVLDRESVVAAAAGADAVVHAATKIPTGVNPDDEDWETNDRVRRDGAENLLAAADAAGADRVVLQSVVWAARRSDGEPFDEDAPPNPDRSTRSAIDAERTVRRAADERGFDAVVLRGGFFYGPDAAHTRQFGRRLLDGRVPVFGRGLLGGEEATLSFVHVADAGRAFADAVEGDATGTFHVVDDEPTTYGVFLRTFADRLGAPRPRNLPVWVARFLVDDNVLRMLTRPMPTSNDRFRDAFGWTPRCPTVAEGIDRTVRRWVEDGTIRETAGGFEWTAA